MAKKIQIEAVVRMFEVLERDASKFHVAVKGADNGLLKWLTAMRWLAKALADVVSEQAGRLGIDSLHEACLMLSELENIANVEIPDNYNRELLEDVTGELEMSGDTRVSALASALNSLSILDAEIAMEGARLAMRWQIRDLQDLTYMEES